MNRCILTAAFWIAAVSYVGTTVSGQGDDQSTLRSDLHTIRFSDGSELTIFARAFYPNEPHASPVMASLCNKNGTLVWLTRFASVDYVPGNTSHYGLVKITEDQIFLFFTWNAEHCTINKRTGVILENGKGDDDLKRYHSLLPLKLTLIMGPSTGYESSR